MPSIAPHKSQIISLFRDGWSCSAIGKRFSLQTTAVSKFLNRQGLRAIVRGTAKTSAADQKKIARLYGEGVAGSELGERYGLTAHTIYDIARRHGVESPHNGGHAKVFSAAQRKRMAAMYRRGDLPADIAARFKTSRRTAVCVLIAEGLLKTKRKTDANHRHMDENGYWRVKLAIDDPMASMRYGTGHVLEHRLVMARKLGRPLLRTETVHHIDGNSGNNDPSNLQLRQGKHGKHVCLACADCGSRNIQPIPIDEPKPDARSFSPAT